MHSYILFFCSSSFSFRLPFLLVSAACMLTSGDLLGTITHCHLRCHFCSAVSANRQIGKSSVQSVQMEKVSKSEGTFPVSYSYSHATFRKLTFYQGRSQTVSKSLTCSELSPVVGDPPTSRYQGLLWLSSLQVTESRRLFCSLIASSVLVASCVVVFFRSIHISYYMSTFYYSSFCFHRFIWTFFWNWFTINSFYFKWPLAELTL